MKTRSKILNMIDFISTKTHCKFKNREGFMLRLFRQKVTDQIFIMAQLKKAAVKVEPSDKVIIVDFKVVSVKLRPSEKNFKWIVEHEFKCKLCKHICVEEINAWSLDKGFRDTCEPCMDRHNDYAS